MNKIISTITTKSGRVIGFRYPTIDDVQIITDFINKISAEKTFIVLQGEQFEVETEKVWLEGTITTIGLDKTVYVMAMDGDKIVGSADVRMRTGVKGHAGVFGIIIGKEYRGDGIGQALMKVVINQAKKGLKDLKIITLEVFGNNPNAIDLYKKFGFVEYGKLPGGIKHNDELFESLIK